jgi:hypothetical protein
MNNVLSVKTRIIENMPAEQLHFIMPYSLKNVIHFLYEYIFFFRVKVASKGTETEEGQKSQGDSARYYN